MAAILEDKELFPESDALKEPLAYVNGGDGSMVLDHEIVFVRVFLPKLSASDLMSTTQLNGDMNYRIDMRRDAVIADVNSGNLSRLLLQDQLSKEMKNILMQVSCTNG